MNGTNERERDGEESTDRQTPDTVDERAAARRERKGYELANAKKWDGSALDWYNTEGVTPMSVSATAEGDGGAWRVNTDTFSSRNVGISYSTDVYLSVDGSHGEVRAGAAGTLTPGQARQLGSALFEAGACSDTAHGEPFRARLSQGLASASGEAPGCGWALDGDDVMTTLSAVREGERVRLDVEVATPKAEACVGVDLAPTEAEQLGAGLYQAGEDAERLAELGSDDVDDEPEGGDQC